MRNKQFHGEDEGAADAAPKAASVGGILVETVLNMQTVSSLALEEQRFKAFQNALEANEDGLLYECFVVGVISGTAMFIQRMTNALLYYWGGHLLVKYPTTYGFRDFLIAQFAFLFSTFGIGAALQDVDDRNEVQECAARLFKILDRQSAIDPISESGKTIDFGKSQNENVDKKAIKDVDKKAIKDDISIEDERRKTCFVSGVQWDEEIHV